MRLNTAYSQVNVEVAFLHVCDRRTAITQSYVPRRFTVKVKGKASSVDIAPLTILNSGALQPRK